MGLGVETNPEGNKRLTAEVWLFVRVVPAVVGAIAVPARRDALAVVAQELVGGASPRGCKHKTQYMVNIFIRLCVLYNGKCIWSEPLSA